MRWIRKNYVGTFVDNGSTVRFEEDQHVFAVTINFVTTPSQRIEKQEASCSKKGVKLGLEVLSDLPIYLNSQKYKTFFFLYLI